MKRKLELRKPLGMVIPLTDEEIKALSMITPDDIERAKQSVTPELRALLNAQPMRRARAQPKRPT